MRFGERLCRAHAEALTITGVLADFKAGLLPALRVLASAIEHAVLGWLVFAPIAGLLVYAAATPLLRRALRMMPKADVQK